jgi:hypothetical protein
MSMFDRARWIRQAAGWLCGLAVTVIALGSCMPKAVAQLGGGVGGGGIGGGGIGGGGIGGGGIGGGGIGGGGIGGAGGIVVDAQGVLRTGMAPDAGLSVAQRKAAVESMPGDLKRATPLRKVALSRLEAEVAKAVAAGRGVPEEFQKLAGLTRVQYVFVYPAEGDAPGEIVIAGPAEPWITDATGRVLGVESGRPTVLLDDLAAALRCFAPGQPQDRLLGCSIDPREAGLAEMQKYLGKIGRVNPTVGVDAIVRGLRESLGPQTVSVQGVSPATHFAHVMVEADYRMKLIGIGLERPPVKMKSWVELASAGSVAANALQRWFFVPDYQCLRISEDDLAMELVGQGVKLCCADEVVLPNGRRMATDKPSASAKQYADTFTRKYPEIAARSPVYAQLRTLIDLAVAAAYMQEFDAYGKARWGAATLLSEQAFPIERLNRPVEVEPAINAVWQGNRLLTPIGGGVTMHPRMALDPPNLLMDEKGEVGAARTAARNLPAGKWWWD